MKRIKIRYISSLCDDDVWDINTDLIEDMWRYLTYKIIDNLVFNIKYYKQ